MSTSRAPYHPSSTTLIARPTFAHLVPARGIREVCRSASPLLLPLAIAWLSYLALAALLYAPALRVYDAGALPYVTFLRTAAFVLAPNWLLSAPPGSAGTLAAMLAYLAIAAALFGSWCWALRSARTIERTSPAAVLIATAVLSIPLLFAPGLASDDLYLYNLYGRMISVYGANPVAISPASFPNDPHLPWVHWKELPSAYGPLWLILAAALSRLAGDSLTVVVVVYRVAGAALHLAVAAALWSVLRRTRRRGVLAATIFYAWNPLVLLEVVANAHNDVLVALFAVLLVGAVAARRPSRAAVFGACAIMVKPFAVLLLPALVRHVLLRGRETGRARRLALIGLAVTVTVLAANAAVPTTYLARNVLNNPAAHMYTNTVWELLSSIGPAWLGVSTVAVQHPYLDLLRAACFAAAALWIVTRRPTRGDVPTVAFRLWLAFCVTACWVWPWYFVPALALAPLAGAAHLPSAAALTAGGLLFWAGWPERQMWPLATLYDWRSLLLFGPLLLVWTWAPARAGALAALGFKVRRPRAPVTLQTAPG